MAALAIAACAPGTQGEPPPTVPRPPPADVVRAYTVCFTTTPAGWAERFREHSVGMSAMDFHLGAVSDDGRLAFGRYRSATDDGVGGVDLASGALTRVAGLPAGASGIGSMASAQAWVVWEQGNSAADLGDWTVRAWNRRTNELLDLATSRLPGGQEVFGQMPLPVTAHGLAAWAQPQPRQGSYPEAKVQLSDLAGRRVTVLDAGRVSGPVFAGPDVVWARVEADGSYSMRAVDAVTLRPAALPERARAPGSVRYLAGSGSYLAWSSGQQELHTWRVGSNEFGDYTADLRHPVQFLQLAGDFALWYAGLPSTVLDLRTGQAFDVRGSLAGSDALIAESEPIRAPATKTEVVPARLSYAPLSAAPRIEACGAG